MSKEQQLFEEYSLITGGFELSEKTRFYELQRERNNRLVDLDLGI